ncbi:hypothetical protein DMA11_21900 [Marinilabiliaceae bacterium JC017]|nr:hypothetical protein DMA11_21900 [Marinilabiliaceae bacterium JC017]
MFIDTFLNNLFFDLNLLYKSSYPELFDRTTHFKSTVNITKQTDTVVSSYKPVDFNNAPPDNQLKQ